MFEEMGAIGTQKNLAVGWAWLEALCCSVYGDSEGTEIARDCPAWVGITLWMWAQENMPEA